MGHRHLRDSVADRSGRINAPGAERRLTTIDELRKILARRHNTPIACPITTGIFAWIAAHAAAEATAAGRKKTTPYWRTPKTGGEINQNYPGGAVRLRRRLAAEGHKVVAKGKRLLLENFESRLATFT